MDVGERRAEPAAGPVAFVHVMKCGGTSLRQALRDGVARLPASESRREVVEPDGAAVRWASGVLDADEWQVRDTVLAVALFTPTTRVVMGHFRFVDGLAPFADVAHFVTVLRDPVERFVSLHRYRTYGDRRGFMRFDGTIAELLEQRPEAARRYGAAYVELFRGGDGPTDRPVAEGDVDAAVANLGRFSVVGTTDRLGRFADDVASVSGLALSVPHLNRNRGDETTLDPGLRRDIEALCRPSIEVYERVIEAAG